MNLSPSSPVSNPQLVCRVFFSFVGSSVLSFYCAASCVQKSTGLFLFLFLFCAFFNSSSLLWILAWLPHFWKGFRFHVGQFLNLPWCWHPKTHLAYRHIGFTVLACSMLHNLIRNVAICIIVLFSLMCLVFLSEQNKTKGISFKDTSIYGIHLFRIGTVTRIQHYKSVSLFCCLHLTTCCPHTLYLTLGRMFLSVR